MDTETEIIERESREHKENTIRINTVFDIDEGGLEIFQYNTYGLIKDEDIVKRVLKIALRDMGFDDKQISIKWGRTRGIDIEARNEDLGHRIIEVKPEGKTDQQTGNYFLNGLAELLQRMDSPDKTYFLALPAHRRYANLIKRLPLSHIPHILI